MTKYSTYVRNKAITLKLSRWSSAHVSVQLGVHMGTVDRWYRIYKEKRNPDKLLEKDFTKIDVKPKQTNYIKDFTYTNVLGCLEDVVRKIKDKIKVLQGECDTTLQARDTLRNLFWREA